ncbi:unnamed protein product, partial [Cyprideis torosa]
LLADNDSAFSLHADDDLAFSLLADDDLADPTAEEVFWPKLKRWQIWELSKRACLRLGMECTNHRDNCCPGATCRCNLWRTNCRCRTAGLFQWAKWG